MEPESFSTLVYVLGGVSRVRYKKIKQTEERGSLLLKYIMNY